MRGLNRSGDRHPATTLRGLLTGPKLSHELQFPARGMHLSEARQCWVEQRKARSSDILCMKGVTVCGSSIRHDAHHPDPMWSVTVSRRVNATCPPAKSVSTAQAEKRMQRTLTDDDASDLCRMHLTLRVGESSMVCQCRNQAMVQEALAPIINCGPEGSARFLPQRNHNHKKSRSVTEPPAFFDLRGIETYILKNIGSSTASTRAFWMYVLTGIFFFLETASMAFFIPLSFESRMVFLFFATPLSFASDIYYSSFPVFIYYTMGYHCMNDTILHCCSQSPSPGFTQILQRKM